MTKLDDYNIERLYIDARALKELKKAAIKAELNGERSVCFNGHWMVLESVRDLIEEYRYED
jgi:hypothetical protein